MIKIFYFLSLLSILFVDIKGQQDTIIYDHSTGNYIIQYVGESFNGTDTLITLTYIPWTKINPSIKCEIVYDIDNSEYIYNWMIENGEDSEQNLRRFVIVFSENAQVVDRSTSGWYSKRWKGSKNGERTFLNKWGWTGDQGLEPSWSVGGFKLGSMGLPSVGFAYFKGRGGSIPRFPYSPPPERIEEEFIKLDAFPGSYVQRETVVPGELPLPFVIYNFLDTLLNYTNQSRNLDWILNDNTADKYTNLFTTAKDQIIQGDSSASRSTLENVLQQVDIDSTNNLTSEAYALLRYNTEYLVEQLPAVSLVPDMEELIPSLTTPNNSGFTLSVKGANFTVNSVVYWNGTVKQTSYLSDSSLTVEINPGEVSSTGNKPVWVIEQVLSSDTLEFRIVNNLPESVEPIVECVRDNGDGSYTAYYGYSNNNNESVFIPVSSHNKISPSPWDRGQPGVFLIGRVGNVFTVDFNNGNIIWHLNNQIAKANKNTEACP